MTIAAANAAYGDAQHRAELANQVRVRKAQVLQLDQVVEEVEESTLEFGPQITSAMWEHVGELADALAVPAPQEVWKARTASRLHTALLAWQDALLDAVAPQRLRFVDRHD